MKRILILFLFIGQLAYTQNFVSFLSVDAESKEKEAISTIKTSIIPFTVVEGMILVEATMNQQKGNYIIDTGAPTLVLNEIPTQQGQIAGQGISQGIVTDEVMVEHFNWSGIAKENVNAFKVDISHLEAVSGETIAGIIGYDILKEVELFVDYAAQTVQVQPVKNTSTPSQQPLAVIPFTMQAHLPVIKVKVGKKKLRLALDTASETNILDDRFLKKLDANLLTEHRVGEIQGVDQEIKQVQLANIQSTIVKDLPFDNMAYLFTDLSHLKSQSGLYIDGLLGYPFLKQGKMSINYEERKIYVWEK